MTVWPACILGVSFVIGCLFIAEGLRVGLTNIGRHISKSITVVEKT
jgi:hypothetical protein